MLDNIDRKNRLQKYITLSFIGKKDKYFGIKKSNQISKSSTNHAFSTFREYIWFLKFFVNSVYMNNTSIKSFVFDVQRISLEFIMRNKGKC